MPFLVEEKYIEGIENELNVKFPPNFRSRMMKNNGGEIIIDDFDFQLYPFLDKSDKKRISRICNHIGLETKNARQWQNFPENAVAIGSDGFGNQIILIHRGNGLLEETLFLWNHENGEMEEIAQSIDDLEK